MLEIEKKQQIRDFVTSRMQEEKRKAMLFGAVPAIIIRESEVEKFIDDLWVHLNKEPTT